MLNESYCTVLLSLRSPIRLSAHCCFPLFDLADFHCCVFGSWRCRRTFSLEYINSSLHPSSGPRAALNVHLQRAHRLPVHNINAQPTELPCKSFINNIKQPSHLIFPPASTRTTNQNTIRLENHLIDLRESSFSPSTISRFQNQVDEPLASLFGEEAVTSPCVAVGAFADHSAAERAENSQLPEVGP